MRRNSRAAKGQTISQILESGVIDINNSNQSVALYAAREIKEILPNVVDERSCGRMIYAATFITPS